MEVHPVAEKANQVLLAPRPHPALSRLRLRRAFKAYYGPTIAVRANAAKDG